MGGQQNAQRIYERMGKRMQQARQEARGGTGLTQQDIAILLDVTPVTLSRWETGARHPSFEVLEQFAKIVGKSLSFFFEEEPRQDEYSQMLLRITDQLEDTEKADILDYARFRYERWFKKIEGED